jgi:hypothetical protein
MSIESVQAGMLYGQAAQRQQDTVAYSKYKNAAQLSESGGILYNLTDLNQMSKITEHPVNG